MTPGGWPNGSGPLRDGTPATWVVLEAPVDGSGSVC
jgi:hypothetical protein